MKNLVRFAASSLLFSGLTATLMPAQESGPPDKPDPAIAEKTKRLSKAVRDRKMERDGEVVDLIGELTAKPIDELHKTDARRVVRSLSDVLMKGKLRPEDRTTIYAQAADGLGKLGGPDSSKVLRNAINKKRFKGKEYVSIRAAVIINVGKTKDPKSIDFLCERVVRAGEDKVLAAAGVALAEFKDAPGKERKEIVKAMVNRYAGVEAVANQPPANEFGRDFAPQQAQNTLRAIKDKWNTSLAALTGQSFKTGAEWMSWFNDVKSDNWK